MIGIGVVIVSVLTWFGLYCLEYDVIELSSSLGDFEIRIYFLKDTFVESTLLFFSFFFMGVFKFTFHLGL